MAHGNFRIEPGITSAQSGFCTFHSKTRADGSNALQFGTKLRRVVVDSQKNFEADPARRLGSMPFYVTRIRTAMGELFRAGFWESYASGLQSNMCGCVVRSGGQLRQCLVAMKGMQTHPHTPGLRLDCCGRLGVVEFAVFSGSSRDCYRSCLVDGGVLWRNFGAVVAVVRCVGAGMHFDAASRLPGVQQVVARCNLFR